MSDDLERATAAFREATSEEQSDRGVDRLELALRRPARTRRVGWYVLPMAAALLVGTAWGSGALSRWLGANGDDVVVQTPPPPQPAQSILVPPPPPLPVATEAAPLPKPTPHVAPAPSAALVDLDALYRRAHDAQFTTHDTKAALAAWDRYLANADPGARLLLEARFNRALALRDLGRNAEARAALQPFAEGDYGAYRRDDAARILQSLP
jgi:hypothetical protein